MQHSLLRFVVSVLLIGYVTCLEWEAIVTTDSGILFFDKNWTEISSGGHQFQHISAFAYDEVRQLIYFADLKDPRYRIYSLDVNPQEEHHWVRKLVPKLDQTAYITGLAFDHLERKLYWTESGTRSVYSIAVDSLAANSTEPVEQSIRLVARAKEDHNLAALTLDECRRHLYWTNSFLTTSNIVRAAMNGTILNSHQENVYQPKGITVDHYSDRIYWVEKKYGRAFTIESADLEVANQQKFLDGMDKVPVHLSVNSQYIYWIDNEDDEVRATLKSDARSSKVVYKGSRPSAVVIRSSLLLEHQQHNPSCKEVIAKIMENIRLESAGESQRVDRTGAAKSELIICLNKGVLNQHTNSCVCLPEYQGSFCEIPICNNFCVHGKCIVEADSQPTCKCQPGFEGERCDRNKCEGYCLNSGQCTFSNTASGGTPSCKCPSNFSGVRCETALCTPGYCYNGECSVDANETAKCKCNAGYRGERCEEYTCNNYCLNDGKCVLNNDTMVVECRCGEQYTGKRCEIPMRFCSLDDGNPDLKQYCEGVPVTMNLVEPQVSYCKSSFNRTVVYTSLAFAASLLILMLILIIVRQYFAGASRPRITKRFKVSTSPTQMTSRPATQCEITIENCCNMNVCETPCFDPKLLHKSAKSDDKQFLLDDIENIAGSYRKLPRSGEKNLA